MTEALLKYETLDSTQIDALMERREVPEPAGWAAEEDDKSGGADQAASDAETVVEETDSDLRSGDDFKMDGDATDKPLH
jgi:cell division protease FtsH